ncbi:hypothetical protein IQ07DRAFT_128419 [Pyrenochaeta sp. DS3sAY3a]|nr:hypothetical protein IQ07DRAFT_128419 [Pyrenochaeta sp. DS3sAY3a]
MDGLIDPFFWAILQLIRGWFEALPLMVRSKLDATKHAIECQSLVIARCSSEASGVLAARLRATATPKIWSVKSRSCRVLPWYWSVAYGSGGGFLDGWVMESFAGYIVWKFKRPRDQDSKLLVNQPSTLLELCSIAEEHATCTAKHELLSIIVSTRKKVGYQKKGKQMYPRGL